MKIEKVTAWRGRDLVEVELYHPENAEDLKKIQQMDEAGEIDTATSFGDQRAEVKKRKRRKKGR